MIFRASAMSALLVAARAHLCITRSLTELADQINPLVRGGMHCYGRFYRSALLQLLNRIDTYPDALGRRQAGNTNDCGPTNASKHGGSGSSIEPPTCSRTALGPQSRLTEMTRSE
jgi:hypothetical protein